jgi:hypothetical protein
MTSKASIRLLQSRIIGLALPGAIAIGVLAKESLAKLENAFPEGTSHQRVLSYRLTTIEPTRGTLLPIFPGFLRSFDGL